MAGVLLNLGELLSGDLPPAECRLPVKGEKGREAHEPAAFLIAPAYTHAGNGRGPQDLPHRARQHHHGAAELQCRQDLKERLLQGIKRKHGMI